MDEDRIVTVTLPLLGSVTITLFAVAEGAEEDDIIELARQVVFENAEFNIDLAETLGYDVFEIEWDLPDCIVQGNVFWGQVNHASVTYDD